MSSNPSSIDRVQLARDLEALAVKAGRAIRQKRRREAWASGLDRALFLLILAPAFWILAVSLGALGDAPRPALLPLTLLVPLVYLLLRIWNAHRAHVEARDSLAVLDIELVSHERLLTAREFLDSGLESPFVEATLEDAILIVERGQSMTPRLDSLAWKLKRANVGALFVASALLLLAFLVEKVPGVDTPGVSAGPESLDVAVLESIDARNEALAMVAEEDKEKEQPKEESRAPTATPTVSKRKDQATKVSDQAKESAGKTGEGRSSDAEASSSASESKGQPSNQSQVSKAPEKPAKEPKPAKKSKKPAELDGKPKENKEDDSGATAGRGSSKGSSKNPAATKWSSKDQVTTQDDQEIEDDEETEDEEEDQESRGGVQPNLRDRKPPVSRDLRIGFGNQKNPDANGRGGPSEAKKSRGTASLVLGVPIPDRIKGQPSAGKTKITQERIEPKPEDEATIAAETREGRTDPMGFVEERQLSPWMRTLVRDYFITLRQKKDRP